MAVDMFFKIGDIKGESADDKHKDEIDVLAWSWGMSNTGTTHTGTGGGAGKVNVQDISFTKHIDASSNALLQACCTGKHYPEATLTVRKAGGKPLEYVVLKLEEVLVTSVSTGGSGGEVSAEIRVRAPLPTRPTAGARYDCASSTCARAAPMRASESWMSRLLAKASSISASSFAEPNSRHHCASIGAAGAKCCASPSATGADAVRPGSAVAR